ncbi:Vacuolar protein-sorting-associated protein 37 1 [Hypsizygus marmoreus]|uniref:Vacuolar protein-sorting-associated protein 37 1 n=1 Tax=Hypsizygus marmoreus TaxID=39966 RepID=A0A369JBR7_HYPMA|nr:Vacuolar protein-sorting-associated protein 37 1 [Hypsizygus marmoreus]
MATQLLAEFPELAHLTREDLEDLLTDPLYFQAIFHSLDRVKALYQSQAELGMANESIARSNLRLQDTLYNLRSDTQDAFDEAKALETRWKELERDQREVYQRFTPQFLLMRLRHSTTAQDDASEALASAFIQQQPSTSGTGTGTPNEGQGVDEFIREFKELRKFGSEIEDDRSPGSLSSLTITFSPPHERRNFVSFTTSVSSSLDLWVVMVGDMVSVNAQLSDDSLYRQALPSRIPVPKI